MILEKRIGGSRFCLHTQKKAHTSYTHEEAQRDIDIGRKVTKKRGNLNYCIRYDNNRSNVLKI